MTENLVKEWCFSVDKAYLCLDLDHANKPSIKSEYHPLFIYYFFYFFSSFFDSV